VVASALASAAACQGETVLGSALTQYDESISELTEQLDMLAACGSGYAHPSVCCDKYSDFCGYYDFSAFAECPAGYQTYPDPDECCPLSDPSDLSKCKPLSSQTPAPASGCAVRCVPGMFEYDGGVCCLMDEAGAPYCPSSVSIACSELVCDAGETCPTTCTSPDAAASCGACPLPFVKSESDPTVCCQTSETLGIECYSQAVAAPGGAGATSATGAEGGGSSGGSSVSADADSGTSTVFADGGIAVPPFGDGGVSNPTDASLADAVPAPG
jgi:hypothetical protein